MRFVAAVVVGVMLSYVGHPANAAEARRERSERCLEICNFTFEQCQKETSPKANGQCNIDVVRCKNACPFETVEEPAVPTVASHGRCVEACRATYKACTRKAQNKRDGKCAADDVRCEQACPKPPEPVAPAAVDAAPGAAGSAGGAPAAAPVKKPKRGPRVEGGAAPAPLAPPPVVPPRERPAQPAEAPAAAPARSEAAAPAAAAPAAATAAAHPEPEKRGFFATLGCFFVACDVPGSTPCVQQCNTAYDECRVRESKRGGECNTRLMNCRKFCSEAAPAQ